MVCSNVSGSRPQREQEASASGDVQVGWAARQFLLALIWWILPAMTLLKPMKGSGFRAWRWW